VCVNVCVCVCVCVNERERKYMYVSVIEECINICTPSHTHIHTHTTHLIYTHFTCTITHTHTHTQTYEGVQDMSCDTLLKIARTCKHQFVIFQDNEPPFVYQILEMMPHTITFLGTSQVCVCERECVCVRVFV
jgi:hypothetical protein